MPEYEGFFKPKNHSVQHAAVDTFNLGPMRGYWCYSFEGFHQLMKGILSATKFGNVTLRTVDFWRMQFAMFLAGI